MRRLLLVLLSVALAGYVAVVAVRNQQVQTVDFVFVLLDVPLWILLACALLLGAALTGLALSWPYLRMRLLVRRQSRRITRLEQEVHGLRTLPLGDEDSTARPAGRKG